MGQKFIKILHSTNPNLFEDLVNDFLKSHDICSAKYIPRGPEADKGFFAIVEYQNGVKSAKEEKIDSKLVVENQSLNKTIDELKKQLEISRKESGLLQSHLSDAENKFSQACSEGEKLKATNDSLNKELDEVKADNKALKAKNTKLEKQINKLVTE